MLKNFILRDCIKILEWIAKRERLSMMNKINERKCWLWKVLDWFGDYYWLRWIFWIWFR